jgi:hypothetical protein
MVVMVEMVVMVVMYMYGISGIEQTDLNICTMSVRFPWVVGRLESALVRSTLYRSHVELETHLCVLVCVCVHYDGKRGNDEHTQTHAVMIR